MNLALLQEWIDTVNLRESIDTVNTLSFVVLMLPLFGFIVLALFGDGIKRDREQKGVPALAHSFL